MCLFPLAYGAQLCLEWLKSVRIVSDVDFNIPRPWCTSTAWSIKENDRNACNTTSVEIQPPIQAPNLAALPVPTAPVATDFEISSSAKHALKPRGMNTLDLVLSNNLNGAVWRPD